MNTHCAFCFKSGANHLELGPVQELTNKCEGGALRLLKDHLAVTHQQPVVDLLGGETQETISFNFYSFFLFLSCRSQNNVNFNVAICFTV